MIEVIDWLLPKLSCRSEKNCIVHKNRSELMQRLRHNQIILWILSIVHALDIIFQNGVYLNFTSIAIK